MKDVKDVKGERVEPNVKDIAVDFLASKVACKKMENLYFAVEY